MGRKILAYVAMVGVVVSTLSSALLWNVYARVREYEIENGADSVKITLYFGDEYNVLVIEKTGSVKMADATCSVSHECTYMSINDSSDTIICVPHKLRVYAEKNSSPTLG